MFFPHVVYCVSTEVYLCQLIGCTLKKKHRRKMLLKTKTIWLFTYMYEVAIIINNKYYKYLPNLSSSACSIVGIGKIGLYQDKEITFAECLFN